MVAGKNAKTTASITSGVSMPLPVCGDSEDDEGDIGGCNPSSHPSSYLYSNQPRVTNQRRDPSGFHLVSNQQRIKPETPPPAVSGDAALSAARALDRYLGLDSGFKPQPAYATTAATAATANAQYEKPTSAPFISLKSSVKDQDGLPSDPLVGSASSSSSVSSSELLTPPSESSSYASINNMKLEPALTHSRSRLKLNSLIRRICIAGLQGTKPFCLTLEEIRGICTESRELFLRQPTLLQLATPVKVVGDLHGQFGDLMRILRMSGMPPKTSYLFLGDYVDRGKQSLETMMLLLCLKLRFPENVFLLRGNHESAGVTKVYGFYDECKRRSSLKAWRHIVDVFNCLPIAAVIGSRIFCVHGGLSPSLRSMQDILDVKRPTDVPESGLVSDLLWSDPDPQVTEWGDNDRGVSYCFGRKVLDKFCHDMRIDLIARGHMVVEDGYEFFHRRKLVTVFSAPNYCGDFDNWGAVMSVDKSLVCSFELLDPGRGSK